MLIHGIWMTGLEFVPLAARLKKCGYRPYIFRYPSLRGSAAENATRLDAFIRRLPHDTVHLIGHSLGGIVLLHLFERYPHQKPGRVLLLGSPVRGSRVAQRIARSRLAARLLLHRSRDRALLGGAPDWPDHRPVAMIAGSLGIGGGRFLDPGLPKPHDGTVSVEETHIPGMAHVCMPASHLGMLLSPRVARMICCYLDSGTLG